MLHDMGRAGGTREEGERTSGKKRWPKERPVNDIDPANLQDLSTCQHCGPTAS